MTEQTQSLDVQQEHQKFIEDLGDWTRSHTCGQLTLDNDGQTVCLMGWVQYRRDHGGLIFVDLRDREGLTQVVFSPDIAPAAHENAHILRSEYVLAIKGVVRPRPEGMTNPNLVTGAIEVVVHEWKLLNTSKTPPFAIEERCDAGENLRLAWRYLDLRRPRMQANLRLRHKVAQASPSPRPKAPVTSWCPAVSTPASSTPCRSRPSCSSSCSWWAVSTATSRSCAASVTKTCVPTASPNSPRWISR